MWWSLFFGGLLLRGILGIIEAMANKPTIKQKDIQAVVKKIAENYKPEKIYLFGSFAWGKPTYDSDVDLFIIKEANERRFDRQLQVRRMLSSEVPVDILVYNKGEIEYRLRWGDLFIKKILTQGKLIYDNTKN